MARKRKVKVEPVKPYDGFRRGLKYSLCLHGLLLLILAGHLPGCGRGGGNSDQQQKDQKQAKKSDGREIVPKPDEVQVELVNVPKEPDTPSYQKVAHKNDDCKDFFGGIGVHFAPLDTGGYAVIKVVDGYPAAKAGIKWGTKIMNGDEIKGEIGTMVDVIIEAPDGTRSTIRMVRDKICLGEMKP